MNFDSLYLELCCQRNEVQLDGSTITFSKKLPIVKDSSRFSNPNMIMAIVGKDGVGIALDMSGDITIPAYMWYELISQYENYFHWLPQAALFKIGTAEVLRVSIIYTKEPEEPAVIP